MKTPPKKREANERWRKAHPERHSKAIQDWNRRNPEARLLAAARHRAKQKGLECTITRADIVIPSHCPVLGIELTIGYAVSGAPGGKASSASLDRIDNTKGYVPGNVQVISRLANTMKGSADTQQLLAFAHWIKETYER